MRKYKVRVTETIVGFIEVEADDPAHAEEVADETYHKNVTTVQSDMSLCGVVCKTIKQIKPPVADEGEGKKERWLLEY